MASQSKKAAKTQVTVEEDGPSKDPVAPSSSTNSVSPAAASSSASAPSSSSSATKKAARVPRVIRPVDPDEIKIQDAERMAQQLLEVNRVFVKFFFAFVCFSVDLLYGADRDVVANGTSDRPLW